MGSKEDGIPTPELPEHVNYWAIRWQEKRTGWHMEKVNPTLVENIELLTSVPGNPSPSKKILVPLCGKTHDLLYLLGLGHQVFGIEGVHECVLGLGERDGFKFNYNSEESIYHTEDGRLQIYCGDLLEIPIEKWGPFDAVWDRGSLVAVEYSHRQAYKEIMKRSLQVSKDKFSEFRYLLEAVEYDRTLFAGPPRAISTEDMEQLYGDWASIELLSRKPVPPESGLRKSLPEGSPADQCVYILRPKV